jgi:hypothetical protein
MMLAQLSNITSVLDNNGAFQEYLHKHGMTQALSKNKLQLRTKHMVLPHVSDEVKRTARSNELTVHSSGYVHLSEQTQMLYRSSTTKRIGIST